jgi:hypothetical protein
MLKNAWDTSSIYEVPYLGRVARAIGLLKELGVPQKLKGLTHLRHVVGKMSVASFTASVAKSLLHGKLNTRDFWDELGRLAKFGYGSSREVAFLQAKRLEETLSKNELQDIEHFKLAGLSARISDESRASWKEHSGQVFSNVMEKLGVPRGTTVHVHGAASVSRAGYDIVSMDFVQDFMFHTAIPQSKFSDFIQMRNDLLRRRPDLFRPENEWKLRPELVKIGEMVEAAHGEFFFDNLLWPKLWKDVGKMGLLSLGWNVGALRIAFGGLHDTAALTMKLLEGGKVTRDDLTWRMMFGVSYVALNAVESAIIGYTTKSLWNWTHPNEKKKNPLPTDPRDYVFPVVGYDSQGNEKRAAPVEYSREIVTFWQHVADEGLPPAVAEIVRNKLNPVLSTVIDEFQNKNYFGQRIYNPNDPWNKQAQDMLKFFLQNTFAPIALSATPTKLGIQTGKELSWWDFAWAVAGFPPAAGWVGRSDTENRIVDTAHRLLGSAHTELSKKRGDAYNALRIALKEQNQAGIAAAKKALADTGVKPPQIKGFETHLRKNPDETYAQHLWKNMPSDKEPGDTHAQLLGLMKPQERETYFKLLTPNGQTDVLKFLRKTDPAQAQRYWQLLGPGGQLQILKGMRKNKEDLSTWWPLSDARLKEAYARAAVV